MKHIILAALVGVLVCGPAWGQEQLAFCSNMRGVSLEPGAGTPQFEPSGFSGTDYVVAIRDNKATVLRKRGAERLGADLATVLRRSDKEGWISFHSSHDEVARLFTLFTTAKGTFLAMTEHQIKFMDEAPQVRSFFANCKSL